MTSRSTVKRARAAQLLGLARARPHASRSSSRRWGTRRWRSATVRHTPSASSVTPWRRVPCWRRSARPSVDCPRQRPPRPCSRWGSASRRCCVTGWPTTTPAPAWSPPTSAASAASPGGCPSCDGCSTPTPTSPSARRARRRIGRLGRGEDVGILVRHTAESEPLALRRACVVALGELARGRCRPCARSAARRLRPASGRARRDRAADDGARRQCRPRRARGRPGRAHRATAGQPPEGVCMSGDGIASGLRSFVVWSMDVTAVPIIIYFVLINTSLLVLIVLAYLEFRAQQRRRSTAVVWQGAGLAPGCVAARAGLQRGGRHRHGGQVLPHAALPAARGRRRRRREQRRDLRPPRAGLRPRPGAARAAARDPDPGAGPRHLRPARRPHPPRRRAQGELRPLGGDQRRPSTPRASRSSR